MSCQGTYRLVFTAPGVFTSIGSVVVPARRADM